MEKKDVPDSQEHDDKKIVVPDAQEHNEKKNDISERSGDGKENLKVKEPEKAVKAEDQPKPEKVFFFLF